jgi:hypothetical protein
MAGTSFDQYPSPVLPLTGAEKTMLAQTSGTETLPFTATISEIVASPAPIMTVAALPATAPTGTRYFVSDATSPTFLAAPVGGGSVMAPVFFNGAGWVVG